ncbi:MAG: hypothetical protein SGILL_000192 [Bacillariaceae sp.]
MTGTPSSSSPRVLTCVFNRRRSRVSAHFETDESTMLLNTQSTTIKAKLPSLKPPRVDSSKASSLSSSFENLQEWTDKRNCDDSSNASEDERHRESPSIFRAEMADYDDREDMLVLKRANPVYGSDDEDYLAVPSKRQRKIPGETLLTWNAQLSEDDASGGFCIRLKH